MAKQEEILELNTEGFLRSLRAFRNDGTGAFSQNPFEHS